MDVDKATYESLQRLIDGDLGEAEAEALRATIAADPRVAEVHVGLLALKGLVRSATSPGRATAALRQTVLGALANVAAESASPPSTGGSAADGDVSRDAGSSSILRRFGRAGLRWAAAAVLVIGVIAIALQSVRPTFAHPALLRGCIFAFRSIDLDLDAACTPPIESVRRQVEAACDGFELEDGLPLLAGAAFCAATPYYCGETQQKGVRIDFAVEIPRGAPRRLACVFVYPIGNGHFHDPLLEELGTKGEGHFCEECPRPEAGATIFCRVRGRTLVSVVSDIPRVELATVPIEFLED